MLGNLLLWSHYSLYSLIPAFVYSSSVPEQLFSAMSVELAEHIILRDDRVFPSWKLGKM